MNLADARAMIARHEGLRLFVYDDATGKRVEPGDTVKGNLTTGFGFNLSVRGISREVADQWLDDDIARFMNALMTYPWFPTLSDNRQAVCLDLMYNVGETGFSRFRQLIAALVDEDFERAAKAIEDSQIAALRRAELAELMRRG